MQIWQRATPDLNPLYGNRESYPCELQFTRTLISTNDGATNSCNSIGAMMPVPALECDASVPHSGGGVSINTRRRDRKHRLLCHLHSLSSHKLMPPPTPFPNVYHEFPLPSLLLIAPFLFFHPPCVWFHFLSHTILLHRRSCAIPFPNGVPSLPIFLRGGDHRKNLHYLTFLRNIPTTNRLQ